MFKYTQIATKKKKKERNTECGKESKINTRLWIITRDTDSIKNMHSWHLFYIYFSFFFFLLVGNKKKVDEFAFPLVKLVDIILDCIFGF